MTVSAPSSALWYDLDETTGDVLAILRLTETDVDAERITALVPAAAAWIDNFLDRCEAVVGPPPSPIIYEALKLKTIILYRQKDAPFGEDYDAPVRAMLRPHKERFGAA